MAPTPDALPGAWNFRDVTEETGITPGRFYRSSELAGLDDLGRKALSDLGISDVADLRSDHEVERRGEDRVPGGVTVHRLPFREVGAHAPHEHGFEFMMKEGNDEDAAVAAARFMTEEYQKYPGMAGAQAAVRHVISLLSADRPVITHCFAGKDRTGFAVALILEAVGVDRDAVMADFMRSNDAVPLLRRQVIESIRDHSGEQSTAETIAFAEARLADEVIGVREDYLYAVRTVIDQQYGSLSQYLDAIGVTPDQNARLRSALR